MDLSATKLSQERLGLLFITCGCVSKGMQCKNALHAGDQKRWRKWLDFQSPARAVDR